MSKNYISANQAAILKLIKLTSDSEIKWTETDKKFISLKSDINGDDIASKAFTTKYKDILFRIFKFRSEYRTKLEIIDEKQEAIWEFPYESDLEHLYETVSFKAAGVDNIYNLLLAEN